jgi:hypothetical protein
MGYQGRRPAPATNGEPGKITREYIEAYGQLYGQRTPNGITHPSQPLPPYGRALLSAEGPRWGTSPNGEHVTINVCIGSQAWETARQWAPTRLVALCPPGEDPKLYDWRFCAGADPIVLWRCGDVDGVQFLDLVRAILAAGVTRVLDADTGTRYLAKEVTRA